MQMLLIVLNKTEKLSPLLDAWMEQGIGGATVLKSSGMVRILAKKYRAVSDCGIIPPSAWRYGGA